jgi:hypothetical protein
MSRRCGRLCVAAALLFSTTLCRAAPDFATARASDDARYAATQALDAGDAGGRPFAIVDKRDARIYVFDAAGDLIGASAALLGLTIGDSDVPDIAQRIPASLAPRERATPAGRFESQPGHNDKGEAIVWVDYDASLAIHRLRPAPPQQRRAERLASPSVDDNCVSLGCVIVPGEFYDEVVAPTLGTRRGVVYVLPETRPVQALFELPELALLKR